MSVLQHAGVCFAFEFCSNFSDDARPVSFQYTQGHRFRYDEHCLVTHDQRGSPLQLLLCLHSGMCSDSDVRRYIKGHDLEATAYLLSPAHAREVHQVVLMKFAVCLLFPLSSWRSPLPSSPLSSSMSHP